MRKASPKPCPRLCVLQKQVKKSRNSFTPRTHCLPAGVVVGAGSTPRPVSTVTRNHDNEGVRRERLGAMASSSLSLRRPTVTHDHRKQARTVARVQRSLDNGAQPTEALERSKLQLHALHVVSRAAAWTVGGRNETRSGFCYRAPLCGACLCLRPCVYVCARAHSEGTLLSAQDCPLGLPSPLAGLSSRLALTRFCLRRERSPSLDSDPRLEGSSYQRHAVFLPRPSRGRSSPSSGRGFTLYGYAFAARSGDKVQSSACLRDDYEF